MKIDKDLRASNHYVIFRIGADTDISNGRICLVEATLKQLELKEDYVACQALYDALEQYYETNTIVKEVN